MKASELASPASSSPRDGWPGLARRLARRAGRMALAVLPDGDDLRLNRADYILAALAGLMLSLAFPRADKWALSWVAMVPLFWSLRQARGKAAFYRGWVFGFFFFYAISFFLNTLYIYVGVVVIGIALMGLVSGLYGALFGWGLAWMRDRFPYWSLVLIPAWWVVLESVRSWGALAFPFGTLAHSQWSRTPLIQIVAVTGVAGLSFLIVLVNLSLARMVLWGGWKGKRPVLRLGGWRSAIGAASALVVLAGVWGWGMGELDRQEVLGRQTFEQAPPLRVLMTQPSARQKDKWDSYGLYDSNPAASMEIWDLITKRTIALTDDALTTPLPHLIIWPETAIPDFFFNLNPRYTSPVIEKVEEWGTPLVLGANRVVLAPNGRSISESYNSAYLFMPDGAMAKQYYDKIHLVPFGEDLTFLRFLPFADALGLGQGAFDIGSESTVFHLPFQEDGVRNEAWFSILICFESTLPRLARDSVRNGARFLVIITNDAWFRWSSGPAQHQIQSIFRAVETRRWVCRCANHGITCLIAPTGRVVARTSLNDETTLSGAIAQRDDITLFVHWGPWFAWLCALVVTGALGWAGMRALLRRRRAGDA